MKQLAIITILLCMLLQNVALANSWQSMNVSAYCKEDDSDITATGNVPVEGYTIAIDHLKFGTEVIVDGHRYIVDDRFGGGYRDRADIFMSSRGDCERFGRQQLMVEIVGDDE